MEHPHKPKTLFDASGVVRPISEHDHDHGHLPGGHSHIQHYRPEERRRLLICIVLTGSMMMVEAVAGVLIGSLALISDAGHMLTHFFALSVSFFAILLARRPTVRKRSFGLFRVEVLAALFNGISLILITAYIFYESFLRLRAPQPIAETEMIVVAVAGLAVNVISALVLMGSAREDINIKGAFLHMLGDTVSSVAIVVGGVIIYFTKWYALDPLLSAVIGAVILVWAFGLIRDSVSILLETTPAHISLERVSDLICRGVPEVKNVHDIHIWEITSRMYAMTAHIATEDLPLSRTESLRKRINTLVDERFDIQHTILQFECAGDPEPTRVAILDSADRHSTSHSH